MILKKKERGLAMRDVFGMYNEMEKENIILAFKGDITQDLLSSVYSIVELRLEKDEKEPRRKKKFFQIVVECLQNVYHHTENLRDDAGKEHNAIFLIGRGANNELMILTGNFILDSKRTGLKSKIDKINSMNSEELRAYHLDKLSTTELSEKGGAGLGIIEIARKSGNKLEYSFNRVSGKHSFFTLAVTVK